MEKTRNSLLINMRHPDSCHFFQDSSSHRKGQHIHQCGLGTNKKLKVSYAEATIACQPCALRVILDVAQQQDIIK